MSQKQPLNHSNELCNQRCEARQCRRQAHRKGCTYLSLPICHDACRCQPSQGHQLQDGWLSCDCCKPFERLDKALLAAIAAREPPTPSTYLCEDKLPTVPGRFTQEDADLGEFKTNELTSSSVVDSLLRTLTGRRRDELLGGNGGRLAKTRC